MKKILSLMLLALCTFSTVKAQATYTAADGTKYEFRRHIWLDLMGGAQYTLGEAKFKDLVSPNVQIGLGYQLSPVFGLRLQANAWQSKGGWNGYGTPPITKDYKYNYAAPGLDLAFNLSNLVCGWNPKRVLNVSLLLGGGANIAWGNDEVNEIGREITNKSAYELEYLWDGTKIRPFGRSALNIAFRLSDAVSLLVEGNANLTSDKYNSKKADNPDWYFNALVGLRFNLGKTYNKLVPPAPAPEVIPVVEPEPEPVAEPEMVVIEKPEPLRRDIFFLINKTDIRESETEKVRDIADYLNKYPESKVVVTGYADAGTGNDAINDRLAAQRADVVARALSEQYGIAVERIAYDSKGSRIQPFQENDLNRVSICIAE